MELLEHIVSHLNRELRIAEIDDYCSNGLEVDGAKEVNKIALMVDASEQGFDRAVQAGANMVIVHHGLIFGHVKTITGLLYRRLKPLIEHNISLYAAHLPLDVHPVWGNNAQLALLLGLQEVEYVSVGKYKDLMVMGSLPQPCSVDDFCGTIIQKIHPHPKSLPFGHNTIKKVAIISGSGSEAVELAAQLGADMFLTGESKLSAFHTAREAAINIVFAGHYFTEVFGLQALSAHLCDIFDVSSEFIDLPTEL